MSRLSFRDVSHVRKNLFETRVRCVFESGSRGGEHSDVSMETRVSDVSIAEKRHLRRKSLIARTVSRSRLEPSNLLMGDDAWNMNRVRQHNVALLPHPLCVLPRVPYSNRANLFSHRNAPLEIETTEDTRYDAVAACNFRGSKP